MTPAPASRPRRLLRLAGISKHFGDLAANDDISLDLHAGEVVALLGENGAGKTTLMNVLFGHYQADAGTIEVDDVVLEAHTPRDALAHGIGMVHQHFTLADNLSALDNITLGTEPIWRLRQDQAAARAKIDRLARELGLAVDPDARVADLSVGQRQRVEILKALYRDVRILILDEPTAVLTPQESAGLFRTLRELTARGLGVLFISHKLNEVLEIAHRMVVLRRGRVVGEVARADTSDGELAHLMVGHALEPPPRPPATRGKELLRLERVSLRSAAGRVLLRDVSLTVRAGEVAGIAGVSGNGQSALADVLAGMLHPDSGRVLVAGEDFTNADPRRLTAAGVARVPEDRLRDGVIAGMTVWENAIAERYRQPAFASFGLARIGAARAYANGLVARFDVRCEGADAMTGKLSGGNIQKIVLGRAMDLAPQVVIACQPTRGLDVGAVTFVHEQLNAARARGAAIVLVSEDLDEIRALADHIHVMYAGRLSPAGEPAAIGNLDLGLMMAGGDARAGEDAGAVRT